MDSLIVVIGAVVLIGLIVWWFFGKREKHVTEAVRNGDRQTVEIVVDGGYKPSIVALEQNIPTDLVFVRKDKSACFDEVILPDFGVRTKLPTDKPYTVAIDPQKPGEYKYSCGMNMFFGKVIVK